MKTTFAGFLTLAVALIGITPSVSRAENAPNYVVFKTGFYSPSTDFHLDNVNGGRRDRFDSKTGFNGEVAIGHYFMPMLAAEVGAGYFESKGSAAASGDAKLKVVPLTVTAKGLLPLGPVEPYGEFGVGAYVTKFDVSGDSGSFSGSSKIAFGLHAGAGVNFNLSETVSLGVGGRYLWSKPSFGGQDIKLDGFTVTANLGFRY
jgi:opacity protein-like surface antigen